MKQTPALFKLSKTDLMQGIDRILKDHAFAALSKTSARYEIVSAADEISFDYHPTILSPKKFFFPTEETLLEYQTSGEVSAKFEANPLVLFGIRPCDLNGIKILDEAFADKYGDPHYLSKREKTMIIGIDCHALCDPNAFCYRVDSLDAKGGFDIMLYDVFKNYLVKVATKRGEKFLAHYFSTKKATQKDFDAYRQEKSAHFSNHPPFKKLDRFPQLFEENEDHPVWKAEGNRCLSCGSCIMVCPTCYCFDVVDELDLNLKKGVRLRKWDACMLSDFAVVAGGENFRHSATERLKHRINRKFNYLMKKHGQSVCVGCGRCVRACLADISPKKIAEAIADEKGPMLI